MSDTAPMSFRISTEKNASSYIIRYPIIGDFPDFQLIALRGAEKVGESELGSLRELNGRVASEDPTKKIVKVERVILSVCQSYVYRMNVLIV